MATETDVCCQSATLDRGELLAELDALIKEMVALADRADPASEGPHWRTLFGVLRDTAYRLRLMAKVTRAARGGQSTRDDGPVPTRTSETLSASTQEVIDGTHPGD